MALQIKVLNRAQIALKVAQKLANVQDHVSMMKIMKKNSEPLDYIMQLHFHSFVLYNEQFFFFISYFTFCVAIN